ncbi:L-sorbosone dehydrogenase [Gemmatimonadetes bacterium T265]|nr:L-sorbosone dehydrogenase [Gemmatimonadetes bacterium T265]
MLLAATAGCDRGGPPPHAAEALAANAPAAVAPACAPDNGGLKLPQGFCATIFADSVGSPRHIAVAPDGIVYVALQVARRFGSERGATSSGGVLALRDRDGNGRSDELAGFGEHGGTGVAVAPGFVYVDEGDQITRYPTARGQLRPTGAGQVIVTGLPTGGHEARNIVLDGRGSLYVNVGSETNSCQESDRKSGSPGADPCTELQTRAGVWRFAADRPGQRFSPAARWATGIRNAMGLTLNPADGRIYTTQHGRDQLYQNWPSKFTVEQSAELPAEEFMQVNAGDDFGWPYCYYDQMQEKLVLAPEYGGDGRTVGRCASKKAPLAAYPGHWAPMASMFYTGTEFPAHYRGGAFISFHGSWNRAPLPQAGFRVVFQPMANGRPSGRYETFADGFRDGGVTRRPVGLAQAPDGGLYVTDDARGRIWKIVYTGR